MLLWKYCDFPGSDINHEAASDIHQSRSSDHALLLNTIIDD